jgi:peptidyl-prolyl cis-trans isomerase-like protein 2
LANKLAKRAEAERATNDQAGTQEKSRDDINWFGVKVGTVNPTFSEEKTGGASVGKYLLKRSQDAAEGSVLGEPKKKRKVGFGDFAGW